MKKKIKKCPKMPSYRHFRAYCKKWYLSTIATKIIYKYFEEVLKVEENYYTK